MFRKIKHFFVHIFHDPTKRESRRYFLFIALLAWVGLGSDSSSSYLSDHHTYLGFNLTIVITMTIFIISWIYGQAIELFPRDGGGYKIPARLANPYLGLISGVALAFAYVLTIALAVSGGMDTLFSTLPLSAQPYKLCLEIFTVLLLMYLNLRGMKTEPIKIFIPLFWLFLISHSLIVAYGIMAHWDRLPSVLHQGIGQLHEVSTLSAGFILLLLALLFRIYSLGSKMAPQRIIDSLGKKTHASSERKINNWAIFLMATLLCLMLGGILLLYALWDVNSAPGKTLNAIMFGNILQGFPYGNYFLDLLLVLEACILLIAANAGFFGGSTVLATLAVDEWAPKRFRHLSSRLVIQNGMMLFGLAALAVLCWTKGIVSLLIVLYCMSIFITFALSMLGIFLFWFARRKKFSGFVMAGLSLLCLLVCAVILVDLSAVKFSQGGLAALGIILGFALLSLSIRHHYHTVRKQVKQLDKLFYCPLEQKNHELISLEPSRPTAVFLIGDSIGEGMHTLLAMRRMFLDHFKNYVFVSVGVIDAMSYEKGHSLTKMEHKIQERLQYFVNYSHQLGIAAKSYYSFGTDPIEKIDELSNTIIKDFPSSIFFAAKLILKNETWLTRLLHNETPMSVQRHLLLRGIRMVILPIQVSLKN